jgi:DNA-binding response OmpR family regulator
MRPFLSVMIIDDEPDILLLYSDYLISRGHKAVTFLTANNIMSDYEGVHPDIMLMDYRLPGKNGLNAAIEIFSKYPHVPILFITAYDRLSAETSKYPILGNKVIQILTKPVKLVEIEHALKNLVYQAGTKSGKPRLFD